MQTFKKLIRKIPRRERRKYGVLLSLFAVGLLLWGRLLLKEVPQSATAVPVQTAQTSMSNSEIVQSAQSGKSGRVVEVYLPNELARNVFQYDVKPYRRTVRPDKTGEDAKFGSHGADEATRIAEMRLAASKLILHSVVLGEKPHAVINGIVVVPGEQIMGFELSQVSDRMVVLTKDGVLLRLRMR